MKKAVVVVVSIISIAVLVTVLVLVLTPKKEPPPVQSIVDMILVEKGTFTMGDTWGTGWDEEWPAHEVTISYDFHIGKHEITFELYDLFCQETERTLPGDEGWGRGQRPVINVSWMDAAAFCNWLSERETSQGIRFKWLLPGQGRKSNDRPFKSSWLQAAYRS